MFNPFYTPVKNIYMYYIYSYERKRRENKKSKRKDRHFIRKDFNYFSGGYSSPLNPSIHRDWLDDKDKNWISKIKEKKRRGGGGGRGKLDRDEEWKNFYSNDFTSVTHFCNGKISNLDLTIQLLMEYSGTRSHFSTRNPFHPPPLPLPVRGTGCRYSSILSKLFARKLLFIYDTTRLSATSRYPLHTRYNYRGKVW